MACTPLQFRQGVEGTELIRIFSRRMDFSASKNRQMFIEILLHMLAHRGVKVTTGRLSKFLCLFYTLHGPERASLVAQRLKRLPPMRETRIRSPGREDPLETEMATHSSILAWRIPWTEKPSRLQSKGLQRVGHD